MDNTLPFPWSAIAEFQDQLAASTKITRSSTAREDALDTVLDDLSKGPPFADEAALKRRHLTVYDNGRLKYRNRAKIMLRYQATLTAPDPDFAPTIVTSQTLQLVKDKLGPQDFAIISDLAAGLGYADIATRIGSKVGTLKTRVCRVRSQLRKSQGDIFRCEEGRRAS